MYLFEGAVSRRLGRLSALTMVLFMMTGCPGGDDGEDGTDAGSSNGSDAGTGGTGGPGSNPMTVGGKVTYDFVPATYNPTTDTGTLAFAQTTVKPVRRAVVQAMKGTSVLATTTTDEQGNYQLTFTPGTGTGQLLIAVLAKTLTPAIQIEDNTDGNAIWALSETVPATSTTVNLHAAHGWTGTGYDPTKRSAAPFAVLDSMYTASRAFMAVRSVNFPALKVNWGPNNVPQEGDKARGFIGTSHYSPSENEIYILGKQGVDTDEFDTHVIVHEWAHYFENTLSRSDSPGGPHTTGDVLDPRIAFGEGYGNALAAMVLPESLYVDTSWSGTSGAMRSFGFDAETAPSPTDDPTPGTFSESSVMRILYDLYDSGASEGHDSVGVGLGTLYDVLVGPQKTADAMTTLGSFIAGLKAQPGVNASAVNALLAHYQVGAITTQWGDGDSGLSGMYVRPGALPYNGNAVLGGGGEYNSRQQNQYYVFTGNGAQVTVSATSSGDVGLAVYQKGNLMGEADQYYSGTETLSLSTRSGTTYVLVLTGYELTQGDSYSASLSIKSP